jgi:hypothetical protein
VEGFEFGLSGTHLIFSSPVALTIDVLGMTDGNAVDIMTMHAGDADFHTGGLSVSPNTLCNTDGTASIPGSQAIVKNGKVTFYTCGASSFTMNPGAQPKQMRSSSIIPQALQFWSTFSAHEKHPASSV